MEIFSLPSLGAAMAGHHNFISEQPDSLLVELVEV